MTPEAKQKRIDEAFAKYHATVNMSASELETWAGTECSKLASLDRRPIERNLRLLNKAKEDWDIDDARDANRTVSFVARMKGAEQGEPAREGCDSKRDISLKNWAYNPGKKSAAAPVDAGALAAATPTDDTTVLAAEEKAAPVEQAKATAGTIVQFGKADDERYTLGIVLVPDEADLQGDVYTKRTIRRAADIFVTQYQNTAVQHNVKPADIDALRDENPNLFNGKIEIVDYFVIPDEMGDETGHVKINGRLVKVGTWLLGHRYNDDDLWAAVKSGKYTGLSMGGFARRVALDGSPTTTA
jgi:hypothetical protein